MLQDGPVLLDVYFWDELISEYKMAAMKLLTVVNGGFACHLLKTLPWLHEGDMREKCCVTTTGSGDRASVLRKVDRNRTEMKA